MADNVAITAGSGTTIAADDIGGVLHQRVKISQGADGSATDVSSAAPLQVTLANTGANTNKLLVTPDLPSGAATAAKQPALGTAGSASADVISVQGIASGTALAVSLASVPSHAVTNAGTFVVQSTIAAGATNIAKAEDAASADADVGVPAMAVRKGTPANTSGADGDYEFLQMSAGRMWTSSDITIGGTAVDGNSGNKSAQTQRVVLATDQPQLTNAFKVDGSAVTQPVSGTFWQATQPVSLSAGATNIAKAEDVASADADVGVPAMVVRKATPANSSGTDGDYEFLQTSGGYLWVHDNKGLANLAFSAAFSTLTRPANTTAYAAADSISDNATAGSVTALSATIADVNDDPIFISEILINSTDTGLAGKRLRAYLFNSDPTASTGVGGGDNATYSQKKAGYIGSFSGVLETGFSDGTVGRLVPSFNDSTTAPGQTAPAGGFIVTKPTSGAKTLFIQYQTLDAFTPSANSTTIIGTARGWQGRAV